MKLLLNAEAFGYGPSASIASIFEIIKRLYPLATLDYIGEDHTLDLQNKLPYSNVYTWSEELFDSIIVEYDFFITALDFDKAEYARNKGVTTIIYDTLCWYWHRPDKIKNANFYIAQDFFGVRERLDQYKDLNSFVIPPLVKSNIKSNKSFNNTALINFGGLDNPYWTADITSLYVQKLTKSLYPVLNQFFKTIHIVCGKRHLDCVSEYNAINVSYSEMQTLLEKSDLVLCTPGLGNIYELANYGNSYLCLPPANDSQGQQLDILVKQGLSEDILDWKHINKPVDYQEKQIKVLNNIEDNIKIFDTNLFSQKVLEALLNIKPNKLESLFNLFGHSGQFELEACFKDILDDY